MRPLAHVLSVALAAVVIAATALAGDKSDSKGDRAKWRDHMGDVPFVIGSADGMKEVAKTGRPPLFFFTADY